MKRFLLAIILFCSLTGARAQHPGTSFRFAFVSDTHVGSPDGKAEEDLRRTVADINRQTGISFVVLTGDITELGTNDELRRAKQILDSLHIPYYIIPGNHDTGWSESGGQMFISVFGNDKFSFEFNGIRMLGCASGPYVRMSDGHVPRSALNWLDAEIAKLKPGQPVLFFNHYPIDNSLDNWYEITDRLSRIHIRGIMCGHGHTNKAFSFEGIPGVMGRSNLRAKAEAGGYNLVDVRADTILYTERNPVSMKEKQWTSVTTASFHIDPAAKYTRPDYSLNDQYPSVKESWRFAAAANVISTPVSASGMVICGDQDGSVKGISLKDGKTKWSYPTNGAIYSSAAVYQQTAVLGSCDGNVYALDISSGKLKWTCKAAAAVMGSPLISHDTVFIGASDHRFYALSARDGKKIWSFDSLQGPVVCTPLYQNGKLYFGAWDRNLYCVDAATGHMDWKWNNGSPIRNFSPAACTPVIHDGVVYVVAPDRYISAIDAVSGQTIWRNNDATVRESMGISSDGQWIFGKTMQDSIVAYATSREKQKIAWGVNCHFGYEHTPCNMTEKDGLVYFGTKNGVVYAVSVKDRTVQWAHKIDNAMVNTVRVLEDGRVLASTMDGKIVLLTAAH
jgi:outer membrane protein assembly factor BamB/predicted phosphodiesterase